METMNLMMTSPSSDLAPSRDVIAPQINLISLPTRGCALVPADAVADSGVESVVRTRSAAKGHVGFAAYVSGHPAWSPPLC